MNENEQIAAIIDIGSNSTKILVVNKTKNSIHQLFTKTIENRIGAGIFSTPYFLSESKMHEAIAVLNELIESAKSYQLDDLKIVATSAVRDAGNKDVFIELVQKNFGLQLHVLTGQEEAEGIAKGVLTDPNCSHLDDFIIIDIGGGSVEIIKSVQRKVTQTLSLPLGAVRLTEQFIKDHKSSLESNIVIDIQRHIFNLISNEKMLTQPSVIIGTGGTIATLKAILAKQNKSINPIKKSDIIYIFNELIKFNCNERMKIFSISENRAEILPAGLAILISFLEFFSATTIQHSSRNLRFGLLQ